MKNKRTAALLKDAFRRGVLTGVMVDYQNAFYWQDFTDAAFEKGALLARTLRRKNVPLLHFMACAVEDDLFDEHGNIADQPELKDIRRKLTYRQTIPFEEKVKFKIVIPRPGEKIFTRLNANGLQNRHAVQTMRQEFANGVFLFCGVFSHVCLARTMQATLQYIKGAQIIFSTDATDDDEPVYMKERCAEMDQRRFHRATTAEIIATLERA